MIRSALRVMFHPFWVQTWMLCWMTLFVLFAVR